MVLLIEVIAPALLMPPPTPEFAELPAIVLLTSTRVPVFSIPPASLADELPETVLAIKVSVPVLLIPPPSPRRSCQKPCSWSDVSVPSFSIPPPLLPDEPSVIVSPEIAAVALFWMSKTW